MGVFDEFSLKNKKEDLRWLEHFKNPGPYYNNHTDKSNTRIERMVCYGNVVMNCDIQVPDLAMKIIYDFNKKRLENEIKTLEERINKEKNED